MFNYASFANCHTFKSRVVCVQHKGGSDIGTYPDLFV